MYKKAAELAPSIFSFFIGNAPNPKIISVNNEKFTVHGEGINGKKVHIEINGSHLVELVKGFLTNVAADEQGLKELLGQLYDLYAPLVQQIMKESPEGEANPMNDMVTPYLNNKTLAVEFAFSFIQSNLKGLLENYDQSVQDMLNSPRGEDLKLLLNESHYMKMDIFTDQDLQTRKSEMEMMFTLPAESSVKGVKITSSSEIWNMNQPVTADTIDTSAGVLELSEISKPAKIVSVLDPQSQLYSLLKRDFNITKKEINMFVDNDNNDGISDAPYNSNGTVMVPVRFVAEQLDADVSWDPATQKVTITDAIDGTVIHLNIGSNQASVNGQIKPLETAAELTNGSTYVPIRFIAESMGAKVSWEQELQMVTITRD